MIKCWLSMWRNMFNYRGTVSRKEYWSACILNIPAMFIFCVPFALILRNFPISAEVASAIFIILFHIPAVALYFRRANDANWKITTTIFMAVGCPVLSGCIVGAFPSIPKGTLWPRFYSLTGKLFALSFGIFVYGGVLGILLFGDPTSIPWLSAGGVLLGGGTLMYVGVKLFLGN